MKDGGAAEVSPWDGCGRERQGPGSLSLSEAFRSDVPCEHIVRINSGETGEEKLCKPKNIIHVATIGNTYRQDFIKCFSLLAY